VGFAQDGTWVLKFEKGVKMPFVAIDVRTKERIDITLCKDPRVELEAGNYVCPLCDVQMYLRAGKVISAHFAHSVACTSRYGAHPESSAHLESKRVLASWLRGQYASSRGAKVELEYRVPEAGRIADIMVTLPTGWRIAHEIQLASITIGEIQERTLSYARAGIDVCWWLGNAAETHVNKNWCIESLGVCGVVTAKSVDTTVAIL
jgi:competence protein CoiA